MEDSQIDPLSTTNGRSRSSLQWMVGWLSQKGGDCAGGIWVVEDGI